MSRTTTVRKYGKTVRKTRAEELFAQLPKSPIKREPAPESVVLQLKTESTPADDITSMTEQLVSISLEETAAIEKEPEIRIADLTISTSEAQQLEETNQHRKDEEGELEELGDQEDESSETDQDSSEDDLLVLAWDDVCPAGNRIEKIAEASFAEVYRITNEHGTSIIKVVRLESPIKPQTKAQQRSGLVDEEPHSEADMLGELRISEWLADIPGFVIYKERYVVQGKAPKALLETHQAFHRRMKRQDPDRLQFYPSPSRYLDDTRFLVIELGDAGTALEDFQLTSIDQVWDIFLHTALALARAEDLVEFEHRDLHEGNLCIRQARPPNPTNIDNPIKFGHSGLDITILDYGLSRASPPSSPPWPPIAPDLETDLTLFTSTHAPQCTVYRQMRSFLLTHDRVRCLPPTKHTTSHPTSPVTGEPLSWSVYEPYTNVLWLAYLYGYLVKHYKGEDKKEMKGFRRETAEMWRHLDPGAPKGVLSFPSAGEVVRFAVEAGWVGEGQVCGGVWGEGSWLEGQGQGERDEGDK